MPAISSPLPAIVSLTELLEDSPLHSPRRVERLFMSPPHGMLWYPDDIRLHCDHPKCGGVRRYTKGKNDSFNLGENFYGFISYHCTGCMTSAKVFGLKAERQGNEAIPGICTKIYQEPTFGKPIPKRLFHVIGEANREHFLQARRAIARGLGIGAYAYYRRIIENTKFDLVKSVLEVAQATNASAQQIELLQKAQSETQFSKALDMLRDVSAIPAVLLIDGHNPLALLHDLLSEGIHKLDDQECLERAQEAEVILCETAERMQAAVTERKTVKMALSSILKRRAASGEGAPTS